MNLSRGDLISIVEHICSVESSEDEIAGLLQRLEAALPGVPWQGLIFWPVGFPHPPNAPEPTPAEIVDRAFAYPSRIIIFPPAPAA